MTAYDLIMDLRHAGADLDIIDGNLRVCAPKGLLGAEVKQHITALKQEIVAALLAAIGVLNERGVRLLDRGGSVECWLWSDADGRDVRTALNVVGFGSARISHLDDPTANVPDRYRQFVPHSVKTIWARAGANVTADERVAAEAKARFINRVFDQLGTSASPSRIIWTTVFHGKKRKRI